MNRYRKLGGVGILAMLFGFAVALPVRSDQKQDIETIEKQIADLQKKLAEAKTKPATPATPAVPEPPAGTLPDSILKKMAWRCIGPANMGGRITALGVYDADPTTYYVATASGGLLKTVNNGTTFDHQFDTQTTVSIGDVAVCQTNPDLVWVGTGEANPRNSVSYGDGVYKSIDGGKTWANMGLKKSFQIGTAFWMPAITRAGRARGSMMDSMMRASPAPSMRADSSSSPGNVRKKPVRMNTVDGRPIAT